MVRLWLANPLLSVLKYIRNNGTHVPATFAGKTLKSQAVAQATDSGLGFLGLGEEKFH
jgi:hypothetical protein